MIDEQNEINLIKQGLKNNGFKINGQTCYLQNENMCFIVFFQKRSDGIYNTNLGIILNPNPPKFSYKECEIGWVYWSYDKGVEAKVKNILQWFEERNTFEKIIEQYEKHNLAAFITPSGKQILGLQG